MIAAPATLAVPASAAGLPSVRWRGSALGAEATLVIEGVDEARATRSIGRVLAEIDRLERIFSLQRSESALSRLNRMGRLGSPPPELIDLLSEAGRVHGLSGGAFDPSVQPLWRMHASHFARSRASTAGPAPAAVAEALRHVGFDRVVVDPREVRFGGAGMALTLNGIAQGAITDRVADLLRNEGLEHVLIDLGEIVATGGHAAGDAWSVEFGWRSARRREPDRLALRDGAVATSDPRGIVFDHGRGRHHHLLDPVTGRSSVHARPVTVVAPRAALADALSTALSLMPPPEARGVAARLGPEVRVIDSAFPSRADPGSMEPH